MKEDYLQMNTFDKMGNVFQKGSIQLQDLIDNVKSKMNFANAGAIFSFTGTVRNSSLKEEKKVVSIEIDAWEEKAIESLETICTELKTKHQLIDIKIWHSIGTLRLKDDIVYVVIASAHRKEGILALDEAIDAYKHLSPLWKKEFYEDGSSNWISESEHAKN